jgi:hypothetical protein
MYYGFEALIELSSVLGPNTLRAYYRHAGSHKGGAGQKGGLSLKLIGRDLEVNGKMGMTTM